MKILVAGGGGREHAICLALTKNANVELYSVMGKKNPGIAKIARETLIHAETDVPAVRAFAKEHNIQYAFIGPEAPLEAGLADALTKEGIGCVGPVKAAARIETDKGFCRELMNKHGIDGCPAYKLCKTPEEAAAFIRQYPGDLAVKPTGLTGGKGVKVMGEQVDREGAVEYAMTLKDQVIILEERLLGEEFTLMAFTDGKTLVPMPLVQDHKRAFEGDVGPNTGGMGSYSLEDHTFPFVTETDYARALSIMQATVNALAKEGSPYKGILYGQFMNTKTGPKVIEFNARFGDPEAMNVLTILNSDLFTIAEHIISGTLSAEDVSFEKKATVCKYLVPTGYPDKPHAGDVITPGPAENTILYYANVELENGVLKTLTSRTMAYVGVGAGLAEAEKYAEAACRNVTGNVRYRSDIGTETLFAKRIAHMKELRS
ncbi:phosphoribosylamine--glycine ligase [Methanocorpusculum bavaricum]|jgi:phosphoribosylamine--glycine ligase|uniref:phosphoribosylamine--glycine ligase n=1 Tax=Methanocorpusculum bavaricum TaxID=71518 RepID=UPI0005B2A4F3|nr:phosphoribosylamine--glycine ligase [Methanocorpusculum bavaricum]MDD2803522.1 phosphoribosylamine--glycine ligase [Methanocorpusculum sp.]MDD4423558.1 phosphoribosylamine--glycine ligase [Methanocorpusculum parvum]MDD3047246.1 phosphoribosylamine--glycine ligase [Methanocorpusculum sp.]NLC91710.1 phosphoribosylamine--glycine ligase [Methanocorpusculum parvum]HJJ34974.1 phosphoribosylamine--glycine ligase [Methanocorpusculum sp.]